LLTVSVLRSAYFLFANHVYPSFWTGCPQRHSRRLGRDDSRVREHDFNQWPIFAPVWMLFLCCFATCSGSTGGGIKMIRAELMVRQALREIMFIHPPARIICPSSFAGQRWRTTSSSRCWRSWLIVEVVDRPDHAAGGHRVWIIIPLFLG